MRRLARIAGWVLPPAAFFAWALWTLAGHQTAAIPAFGPPDPHLEAWRWRLLAQWGVGALLAGGWALLWARLKASKGRMKEGAPAALRRRVPGA
ncbi:MAG: hypothetical protein LOD85_04125 [Clostridia bacterium]|nr:hypothetical protein [Bacillota bacterium]MBO2521122.1 hypothetical protein [Bacillota bacterium]